MEFRCFDPSGCDFPPPCVPLLPALGRHSLARKTQAGAFRSANAGADASFFIRGRYALAEAYRQAGVGPHGALLVPAYHCLTMLDPAIRLGAEVLLYGIGPTLVPDMVNVAACLRGSRQPVKAMLVPHYFGFAQDLAPIARFCTEHGIALIEDCCHAMVAGPGAAGMGRTGRFCVASPYKVFPCDEGGLLWAGDGRALHAGERPAPSLASEARGILRSLQHTRRQKTPPPDSREQDMSMIPGKAGLTGRDEARQDTRPSRYYAAVDEQRQSLRWSRWISRHTDLERLAVRRRDNYQRWVDATAALPHCQALFPDLPDDCVPYMFPLHISHPDPHFFALKQLGMPIWRWDEMAASDCSVASDYRLQLLHLPCHQELTNEQMAWMTSTLAKVLALPPHGCRT